MAALTTSNLVLPVDYARDVIGKIAQRSVIGTLCPNKPQLFADEGHVVFTKTPLAEYVGEGAEKSASEVAFDKVMKKIFKLQTTVRLSDEVKWADEDGKVAFLDAIIEAMGDSISQGVDYGLLHGWNPLGQATSANLTSIALIPNANQVTASGDPQADMDALPDTVLANYNVTGIALDRMYANTLRKERNADGAKLYPEINMTLDPGSVEGLTAVTSGNVGGAELMTTTAAHAIVGDWSKLQWGFVRNIAVKPIEYGDPDGQGDLQRYNQIAYRCELVFAALVLDPKAWAVLKPAA